MVKRWLSLVFVFFLVAIALVPGEPVDGALNPADAAVREPLTAQAVPNLTADPYGRVIDVTFNQDVTLTAPWDRFRFEIDMVQPLARDGGAFLADLSGDGVPDLLLSDWLSRVSYFPGITDSPTHFGEGRYLLEVESNPANDPFTGSNAGWWTQGACADLDGNGNQDCVIGDSLYKVTGSPAEPELEFVNNMTTSDPDNWDPAASIGDLNGDGTPDVVVTWNYSGTVWVFWNFSTPGAFSFTPELLYSWGNAAENYHLSLGDLNGDDLLDLAAPVGIYYNTGSLILPSFNFTSPEAWNKSGGLAWTTTSDQPPHIFLLDADGDELLDAYVSNLIGTVWQVLFYKNAGTAEVPVFEYVGPVTTASTPLFTGYRNSLTPNISPHRAYVSSADYDGNSLPDIFLGDQSSATASPTVLWNNPTGLEGTAMLSYQDLYTYPALTKVDYNCGEFMASSADGLCRPPNLSSAWVDLTGDGLEDVLHTYAYMEQFKLYINTRTGTWPFVLNQWQFPTITETSLLSSPSGSQITGMGAMLIDLNQDTIKDIVTGTADGRLLFYAGTAASGPLAFADPLPLTDSTPTAIDVGTNSWPTPIDLDGDSDLDFLVSNNVGSIYQVFCTTPGSVSGYTLGSRLGTAQQAPLDLTNATGGGFMSPSLASIDIDQDGLVDVVAGLQDGTSWLLHNIGPASAPVFDLMPLTVSRTTAANMTKTDARHIRLYFALPAIPGQTQLLLNDVPLPGGTVQSGTSLITAYVAPPTGLIATAFSPTRVDLTWNNNEPGATSMTVQRSPSGTAGTWTDLPSGGTLTSYSDTSAADGTKYFYQVIAVAGAGQSVPSSAANATTPLYAPSGLSAAADSASQITLLWTNNSTNATLATVQTSPDGSRAWTDLTTTAAPGSPGGTYQHTGVSEATTVYYRVSVTNAVPASSAPSDTASATTLLKTPTGLIANPVLGTSQINIQWGDASVAETGYLVQWAASGDGPWTDITTTPAGATSYLWTTTNGMYFIRVRAVGAVVNSAWTLPVEVSLQVYWNFLPMVVR